jgi:hypothetical protein
MVFINSPCLQAWVKWIKKPISQGVYALFRHWKGVNALIINIFYFFPAVNGWAIDDKFFIKTALISKSRSNIK